MPVRERVGRIRRSPLDVATEKLALEKNRKKAVAAYESGEPVKEIAALYNVKPRTVIDWVKAKRRLTHTPVKRVSRPASMGEGAGGKMLNCEVRTATLKLEEKIVALMAMDGFAPLDYRRAER